MFTVHQDDRHVPSIARICLLRLAAFMSLVMLAASLFIMLPANTQQAYADTGIPMYRLYNPNSGEHFYTANAHERDNVVTAGWRYEGVGWYAPTTGEDVYRLYNGNAGDHHYTLSAAERDMLINSGWEYEGVGWKSSGTIPLYRQYNVNKFANNHNYTTNIDEHNYLVSLGWRDEHICWYGVGAGHSANEFDLEKQKVLEKTNEYRAAAGLSALTLDTDLGKAAQRRAEELLQSYSHTRPNGLACWSILDEMGIPFYTVGENIAEGQTSGEQVALAWYNSPAHKANMLNPAFGKLGVGVYKDANGRFHWVQMFTN